MTNCMGLLLALIMLHNGRMLFGVATSTNIEFGKLNGVLKGGWKCRSKWYKKGVSVKERQRIIYPTLFIPVC